MPRLSDSLKAKERLLLQTYLKAQGMNRSRVRDAILDLIGEQMGIFSSEDLIALAREQQMAIGDSSIYGCIDLFVKIGILLPLPMGLAGSLVRKSLCHGKALLLCRHCGSALLHRSAAALTELQTVTPPRFSDVTPLLLYWGVCPQCYRLGRR